MLRDLDSLVDIVDAAQRILKYTQAMTKADFAADFKTQDAVNRCLEIIGEATKRLSSEYRGRHPQIAWQTMAGMRDILIHAYDKVNVDVVWETVTTSVPALIDAIQPLISAFESSDDSSSL